MMRISRLLVVIGAAALTLAFPASAAVAADATGCSGSVVSMNAAGDTLGTAQAPGPGGTQSDPLPIDTAGKVAWKGSTDSVITNADWKVTIAGATFLSGTFANTDGLTTSKGVQDMSAVPGLLGRTLSDRMKVHVEGQITGTGGSCAADGYVTGVTPPLKSPSLWAGVFVGAIGTAMGIGVLVGTKAAATATVASGGGVVA
jgi:hypothetical protein